jgi:hypothetical protein
VSTATAPAAEDKDTKDVLVQEYFDLGSRYYSAARFAAIAGFAPIAGNLFHHALEMFLKGGLCRKLDEKERKNLWHKLRKIWTEFKLMVADPSLNKFDATIASIDDFEEIRYPEATVRNGIQVFINLRKPDPTMPIGSPGRPEPVYNIVVDELDELVKVIFEKCHRNPKAIRLSPDALKYLEQWNNTTIW